MSVRKKVQMAIARERDRCQRIAEGMSVEPAGFHLIESRAEFAAFNMGRIQEAIVRAIMRGDRPKAAKHKETT